ncbi:Nn.00g005910.m01.CDS01 [Neocucurbitaria sp. VM-36]
MALQSDHCGRRHLVTMQDYFQVDGPNGTHDCLVLEILGPSVADLLDAQFCGERLPGNLAKRITKQALLGLCCLHDHGIGHGDLHIRNLAFTIPSVHALCEDNFLRQLGKPETSVVKRRDGRPIDPSMPDYLVRPTSFPIDLAFPPPSIKIMDFGQSFLNQDMPDTFHTPLVVRAPEVIFEDNIDYRMDLWSMGCLFFELVVGQPPFDSFMITPAILVSQMLDMACDDLPDRWQEAWRVMKSEAYGENYDFPLQEWLEKMYFDGERRVGFNPDDILGVGDLIGVLLRFEPSARASSGDVLKDRWFLQD